ncbi:MAG: DUF1559 domain-containing protein [Planctomyces sp.]|nr:DUF1559 domain-containing protein [Planctomyces sp.]
MLESFPFPPPNPEIWRNSLAAFQFILAVLGVACIAALIRRLWTPVRKLDLLAWFAIGGVCVAAKTLAHRVDGNTHDTLNFVSFLLTISAVAFVMTLLRLCSDDDHPRLRVGVVCLISVAGWSVIHLEATSSRIPAARTNCRNMQLNVDYALRDHAKAFGELPPAVTQDGGPPRSWRVELLPFLESGKLRERYVDSLSWDAPANLEFAQRDMQVFFCPNNRNPKDDQGRRFADYLAVTGTGSVFDDAIRPIFARVPDGSSNTILLIESSGQQVVWTEPRDADIGVLPIEVNANGPRPGASNGIASSYHGHGFNAMFAGGNARYLSSQIDRDVLLALLTANGGESVPPDF